MCQKHLTTFISVIFKILSRDLSLIACLFTGMKLDNLSKGGVINCLSLSRAFNRVCQGRILSPLFFNVFVDELTLNFSTCLC